MVLALAACQVVLVSDYDEMFDQELTSTQKDVAALLTKIGSKPNPANPLQTGETYAADADAYQKIGIDLSALAVRAAAHRNNAETVDSVQRLTRTFSAFEAEHKASLANPAAPLPSIQHVKDELNIINGDFKILMAQELLKKSGK
jgi:hypothetical protein